MVNFPSMQQLLEAGVHFGHQVRRGNPRMKEYIFGARDGVHIINLEQSEQMLKKAAEYVQKLAAEGKVILFVGTKKQAQPIIESVAKETNSPYVAYKWVGGLLTNFDEIRKNIRTLQDLADKKAKGQLSHYTKKEQLLISRRLDKFDQQYGGVATMEKLPDAIFLVDCVGEKTALAEAMRMGISVIGIADTNSNPALLDYAIPGNDDATKSLKILIETLAAFYKRGLKTESSSELSNSVYSEGLKKAGKAAAKAEAQKSEAKKKEDEGVIDEAIAADVMAAEEEVEKKAVAESSRVE